MKVHKNRVKSKLKELPINLGLASIAALFCLAEGGTAMLSEILEGPYKSLGKRYEKALKSKNFLDYYEELKDLKENSARTMLWRLQQKGLVEKKEKCYQLTLQGLKLVKTIKDNKKIERAWDGKWRIISFDIPEKKRGERNWLRWRLICCNYKLLQKSVFIGKQPLEEDFYEEILLRKLNPYIRLITVGEIDDDKLLDF